jgi:phospholipid/cholesterol/gamma-HCH transport system ATP-binding protein
MSTEKDNRTPVIRIRGLNITFGNNAVLRDFDMDLFEGENLVVLGKSGSGKSVLIKCIIGLLTPDSGSIEVFGKEITKMKIKEMDDLRLKLGFLFQSNALYDSLTVRENLEFPLRRHWNKEYALHLDDLVLEALENVGLAETIDLMPDSLSGGMRKRIALARTIILKPSLILYDEPTTGLDSITGKEIIDLILEIQKKFKTSSIIISHDLHCAKNAANRIILLREGKCYAEGTYDEMIQSKDKIVNEYFQ